MSVSVPYAPSYQWSDCSSLILFMMKNIENVPCSIRYQAAVRQVVDWLGECARSPFVCTTRLHRTIIIRMLIQCFARGIDDSSFLALVLQCALSHNIEAGQIVPIVDSADLPSEKHVENCEVVEKNSQERRSDCFLTYCLYHANESRLTCGISGRRYVTMTWEQILLSFLPLLKKTKNVPPTFLTWAQYGACLSEERRISSHNIPYSIVQILHKLFLYRNTLEHWNNHTIVKVLCSMISTLLKDTVNPHEVTFWLAGKYVDGMEFPDMETIVPFYDDLFPHCLYGTRQPASLSHMCRYVIRKRLFDNWKLPEGIHNLPIPDILKKYLNLLDNWSFPYEWK